MPPLEKARKNGVGGRDHISNLPDGVLEHILSFLPSQDAVRTCVLAKRWRHMWRSTTVLRFVCGGMNEPKSIKEIQKFMERLLCLRFRGSTPLDTCEFRLGIEDFDIREDGVSHFINWIRIALLCKVRVLQFICVGNYYIGIRRRDGHPFFMSQYLKRLELQGIKLMTPSLNFSFCPFLEDLEIVDSCLASDLPISSESLKHLTIDACYFPYEVRVSVCAPNLVSLWLVICGGRTPSLQRMPSLLTAVVKILGYDHVPLHCDNDNTQSILLQGLSEVRNLVLMSPDTEMCVFRRDLKFCSSFNKLKCLLLNEYWCEPADFSALACLLKLSPVLEKLTLQLYSEGPKHKVEIKLRCKPMEMSAAISQHLQTIEVKCEVYDERVRNVLTFLGKLNIWFQFSG